MGRADVAGSIVYIAVEIDVLSDAKMTGIEVNSAWFPAEAFCRDNADIIEAVMINSLTPTYSLPYRPSYDVGHCNKSVETHGL